MLLVMPTGSGKSLCYQLIASETSIKPGILTLPLPKFDEAPLSESSALVILSMKTPSFLAALGRQARSFPWPSLCG